MFCALGNITFAIGGSPKSLKGSHGESFAEQKIVDGKPLLQATGHELDEYAIEMFLHVSFSQVASDIANLKSAMAARQAMGLVLGNGKHLGRFVIVKLDIAPVASLPDGTLIAATISARLREYVKPAPITTTAISGTRKPTPKTSPIAVVKAPAGFNAAAPISPRNLLTTQQIQALAPYAQPGASPLLARNAGGTLGAVPLASDVPVQTILRNGG